MSDERDNADAAADGTEDQNGTPGGQTAVVAPQRPTGKRSRQRALSTGVTDAEPVTDAQADPTKNGSNGKGPKTKTAKAEGPSRNPILYVVNYLKQVVAELRKVIWPNRKQMVTYTSVVLVFLAFMVALISGVDLGLGKLVSLVFG